MGKTKNGLLVFFVCCLCACSPASPPDFVDAVKLRTELLAPDLPPLEIVPVDDFLVVDDDLDEIVEQSISIDMDMAISLDDFVFMLSKKGVSIVCADGLSDKSVLIPHFRGSLRDLLTALQKTHGFFYKINAGVLSIHDSATVFLKVLSPGSEDVVQKLAASFGIDNSYFDRLNSRLIMTCDFNQLESLRRYFSRAGSLSVAVFDIAVLEAGVNNETALGFDWSSLGVVFDDAMNASLNASVTGGAKGSFSLSLVKDSINFSALVRSLEQYSRFTVSQKAVISSMNGSPATLDVSEKVPYVSNIQLGYLSNDASVGSTDVVQNFTFAEVSSGLTLSLLPIINPDNVILEFDGQIQSISEFITVGTSEVQTSRPVVARRNVKNSSVVRPGSVFVLGGLYYERTTGGISGLYGSPDVGMKESTKRMFEISIIGRCRIIRFELENL